jgi:hypothetical protein
VAWFADPDGDILSLTQNPQGPERARSLMAPLCVKGAWLLPPGECAPVLTLSSTARLTAAAVRRRLEAAGVTGKWDGFAA